MDRKVFTAFLLSFIVVGLVVLAFALLRQFLLALLWGAVLAIVTYRSYEQLCGILGGRRTLAAFGMTLMVMIVVLGPFLLLTLTFYEDAVLMIDDVRSGVFKEQLGNIMNHPLVVRSMSWAEEITGNKIEPDVIVDELKGKIDTWTGSLTGSSVAMPLGKAVGDVLGFMFRLLASLFFIVLSVFYFYKDGPSAITALRDLIPMSEQDRDTILGDIHGAINAAVRGGLVTAIAQGFLGFVILFILGFERPVLWASVMALASLIPLIGTAAVWLPLAGLLAIDGQVAKALILMGYGVVVIGMADNFLRPMLVGQHMEAHPLLLFFGILGGIAMFGFVGIILGPVVIASLNVTTKLLRREFAEAT